MKLAMNDQNVAQLRNAPQPVRRRQLIDVAMGKAPAETIVQGTGSSTSLPPKYTAVDGRAIKGGASLRSETSRTRRNEVRDNRRDGTFITPAWLKATHQYHSYLGLTESSRPFPSRRDGHGRCLLRRESWRGAGGTISQRGI